MSNRVYKSWLTIHDANDWEPESFPPLAMVEVWCRRPIGASCILGSATTPTRMEVLWLDDSMSTNIKSIGTFGYIELREFIDSLPPNKRRTHYQWFTNPISEAVYGTYLAFDTLPVVPFDPKF